MKNDNDNEFTLKDIENKINNAIANKLNIDFLVKGYLAKHIIKYLNEEHYLLQLKKYNDKSDTITPSKIDDNENYLISIVTYKDYIFQVQEAFYKKKDGNKIFAENNKELIDVYYIQLDTNISLKELTRCHGKQRIIFDYVIKDSDVPETTKKCTCDYCKYKSTYKVNGKEVNKETYDKAISETQKLIDKCYKPMFDYLDKMLDFFN